MKVYKKIILFCIVFSFVCTCLLTSANAIDYTVYNSSINDTYQEYFKRILLKNDFIGNEYVCFRASNNEYYLFFSPNLELHNNEFICNISIEGCKIDTVNISGSYNTYQSIEFFEIDNFKLSCDDKIVYSSLGNYPTLYESGEVFEQMQVFMFVGFIVFSFIWFIFRKCQRF